MKKGFTLIELIMVIVILSILLIVVVPKLLDLKADAATNTEKAVIAAVQDGINMQCMQNLINE
ncbi:MAG: prepilin-type N-terminal cleavage/methylation domain-containing protein [Candidatus Omnitrophica bacterium]|nr:prepilin-type N-terminal cleavage/methylation domain-containing protein [Candidatus Omnitrophota bacterium]